MIKFRIVLTLAALAALTACANERVEPMKTPCVGLEGSPCGPKRAVNQQDMVEAVPMGAAMRQA